MSLRHLYAAAALGAGPLCVLLVIAVAFDPVAHEADQAWVHRQDGYAGSSTCRSCHPDQHASWHRTYHRTMTQLPSHQTVQGAFDGRTLRHGADATAVVTRRGDTYLMVIDDRHGAQEHEVALAVGSRRYQQYFERVEDGHGERLVRLPFLWHMEEQRWMHLNTVFLGPDDTDWDLHRATWNENCILCHNTGPRPGLTTDPISTPATQRRFHSATADLGIACEACHGPGAAHAERHRHVGARYGALLGDAPDPTIINPARLDQAARASVCGQCHGQRLPNPVSRAADWITKGPTFRPGDILEDHASPIHAADQRFAARFWGDGTPRLTAYEYQGMTRSPCYQRGTMTCGSCHDMHGGDPRGMIHSPMRGNQACTQCHEDIGRDVAAHTGHDPGGAGSSCMACHMPSVVYGVLEIHRSHQIEIPDPARDGEAGRPHACTLCHLDRSLTWSAEAMTRMWGTSPRAPHARRDGAPVRTPDGIASLLAGDPVQRSVYAEAFRQLDPDAVPESFLAAARYHLTVTLGDGYPAVRRCASRSLRELGGPTVNAHARRPDGPRVRSLLQRMATASGKSTPRSYLVGDLRAVNQLLELQSDSVIRIGE